MTVRAAVVPLLAALAFAGCSMERHRLSNPGRNQVVRVESGDRFFMDLDETDGCRWSVSCADPDVEVRINRSDGVAEVMIRIHRGYDGPSAVTFSCRRHGEEIPSRKFAVTLYKRTGDVAFWE